MLVLCKQLRACVDHHRNIARSIDNAQERLIGEQPDGIHRLYAQPDPQTSRERTIVIPGIDIEVFQRLDIIGFHLNWCQ